MITVPIIPDNAPFTVEQRSWLNGFLAGMLSRGNSAAPASVAADTKRPLLIAFGSQSGNAESLAKKVAKEANRKGFSARAAGLEALQPADFTKDGNVLIITSTWGEGDMPDNAVSFWDGLNQNGSSPRLAGVNFSVLALGDKNYGDTFCLAGKKLDERLEQLGARRVHPRVDCDVDFDESAKQWSEGALDALLNGDGNTVLQPVDPADVPAVGSPPAREESGWSKKNPFPAKLIANIHLNRGRSSKDTRHIAFSLTGSGLAYELATPSASACKTSPASLMRSSRPANSMPANR